MSVLVCGSMAYDSIFDYDGVFKERINFENTAIINASFLAQKMHRHFGGCAGNIAYGLKMLGCPASIVATMGEDANDYLQYLQQLNISSEYIKIIPQTFTVQLMIINDKQQNQINTFYPGAMAYSHTNENYIPDLNKFRFGIVSPDGKEGMLKHLNIMHKAGLEVVFDPGQALPLFNKQELLDCISKSTYLTLNEYEYTLLHDITTLTQQELLQNFNLQALIITLADKGACLYSLDYINGLHISGNSSNILKDPTGCGDAFRAGLLHGLSENLPIVECIKLANTMGEHKIKFTGGQGYSLKDLVTDLS